MDRKLTESYVCIDLETTGLEAKRDRIIEIGAVQVENNRIVREWETFVDPDRKLDENIAALTGIHDEQLCGAPQIAEVLPEVFAFIGDHVLLGHRVMFDYAFLKKAAVDNRMSFEKRLQDPALRPPGARGCKGHGTALSETCRTVLRKRSGRGRSESLLSKTALLPCKKRYARHDSAERAVI